MDRPAMYRRKIRKGMKSEPEEEGEGEPRPGASVVLIEKATNSTRPEVEPHLLKAIKLAVRYSDSELRLAAQTLMSLMKRDHSQVRYLALLIIDELFMRSKVFRTVLVESLDQLLALSVGFRRNLPLPAPTSVASALRSKAIEFLEKWYDTFGVHYRQLRLGYDYLKNTLRYQFPNLQANALRIQQERRERETRTKQILLSKFETLRMNFASFKGDIQSTVDEICECLDVIQSRKDDDMPPATLDDDEEMEEFHNSELRQIRLDSLKEGQKIPENFENKVIFDALRESYKLLVRKHLVAVQESISTLVRVEVSDNRFRDTALKELIDIRNNLHLVKKRCEEAGCFLSETSNKEEEDIWEEATPGSSLEHNPIMIEDLKKLPVAPVPEKSKVETPRSSDSRSEKKKPNHVSGVTKSDTFKNKLLAEAPVVTWGPYLDNWGSNRDFLANQRGLDLESHWGRVDEDAVIPAHKIAELSVHATVYEEEPVEIFPCRAPLRKGGLCQRRDLKTCPFHGPIIPRDDEGKPINSNLLVEDIPHDVATTSSTIPELAPDLMEHLAKQAVKNVRERDEEEAKRKHYDKLALKRAKLAKVREHNQEVLRDAAIASTSRSSYIGDDSETADGLRTTHRNKKETLASMLRKKETVKDRLAQKLLSSRASEATVRQLTMEQEGTYREAFPNQW